MPQGNRPGDQRRADANAARAKGATTRAVGTTRGETTGGSRSNSRGGMSPIGSSQPPSMGLSQSAINNASFIDYRRKPGDTARETLDLGRFAGPTFHDRLTDYHRRLTEIDQRNVRDTYSAENNDIMNGHPFGKRPPVIKGSQNTTSPKSAPDIRAGRDLRKLASDTRAGHRGERGRNAVYDDLNEQNVRNANATALMHENAAKSTANAHANAYYGRQTDRMREMTENKRQPGRFDGPAPDSSHLDNLRYGTPVATRENVARDLMEYAGRSLPSGKASAKTAPSKGASTGRKLASIGALAAGSFAAGQAGVRSVDTRSAAEKMRDDASDMGPVKGRVMERRSYQAAGGTRPAATKIVAYKGQTKRSRVLGVSNVKAGQN